MLRRLKVLATLAAGGVFGLASVFTTQATAQAPAGEPIRIGFAMSLTGPLAANGKQALLGMKIWEDETNAKGGLPPRRSRPRCRSSCRRARPSSACSASR